MISITIIHQCILSGRTIPLYCIDLIQYCHNTHQCLLSIHKCMSNCNVQLLYTQIATGRILFHKRFIAWKLQIYFNTAGYHTFVTGRVMGGGRGWGWGRGRLRLDKVFCNHSHRPSFKYIQIQNESPIQTVCLNLHGKKCYVLQISGSKLEIWWIRHPICYHVTVSSVGITTIDRHVIINTMEPVKWLQNLYNSPTAAVTMYDGPIITPIWVCFSPGLFIFMSDEHCMNYNPFYLHSPHHFTESNMTSWYFIIFTTFLGYSGPSVWFSSGKNLLFVTFLVSVAWLKSRTQKQSR